MATEQRGLGVDQQIKMALGVASLLIGLLLGINVMVAEEPNGNWLAWALGFLALAFLFWFWLRRDDQNAQDAAERALQSATDELDRLESTVQTNIGAAPTPPLASSAAPATMDLPIDVEAEQATGTTSDATSDAAEDGQASIVTDETTSDAVSDIEAGDQVSGDASPADTDETVSDAGSAVESDQASVDADAVDTTVVAEETRPAEEVVQAAYEGDPIAKSEVADATASAPATEADVVIPPVDAPEDDLTRIEGIGPYYNDLLRAAGIDTYAQLAALDEETIAKQVQEQGGRRSASMTTWAEQAQLAAAGDWDGLATLQDELKSGRRE